MLIAQHYYLTVSMLMDNLKLWMVLLGCRVKGRHTEQHDVFFGIADSVKALIPAIHEFWPEAKGHIHLDGWRAVTKVGKYAIEVVDAAATLTNEVHLYFINLGGYSPLVFDELHHKILAVGNTMAAATAEAKKTAFYTTNGFKGAASHIDDKYGVDIDDVVLVKDILTKAIKSKYQLKLTHAPDAQDDELHIGYFKLPS